MKRALLACTILLFFLTGILCTPGDFRFRHLTVENGLSNGDITGIAQDNRGFIWIGTRDGLNRYDGYDFKVYRHDREDSLSICNSAINILYVCNHGCLWIGTDRGLSRYIPEKDNFLNFTQGEEYPHSLRGDKVNAINEDIHDKIWIGTAGGGINLLDQSNETLEPVEIRIPGLQFDNNANTIVADRDGDIWIGTYMGLIRYISKSDTFIHYCHEAGNINSLPEDNISALCEDGNGNIWIGTWTGGICLFDKDENSVKRYGGVPDLLHIHTIHSDGDNNIWAGILDGFVLYNRSLDNFRIYKQEEKDEFSQLRTTVTAIFRDNQNNLWLGHNQLGISFSLTSKEFMHYIYNPASKTGLSNSEVTAVLKDRKGRLWVGFWCGNMDIIDLKNNITRRITTLNAEGSSGSGTIFSIIEDSGGKIWFSSYTGGLQTYNEMTGNFDIIARCTGNENTISGNDIRSICEDDENNLWLAVQGKGVDMFNPRTGKVRHYRNMPDEANRISSNWTFSIVQGYDGNIWVGSSFGISRIDKERDTIRNYFFDPKNPNSLINDFINIIYSDNSGNLWIGTNDGLSFYNSESERFTGYTIKDGLPNNVILGILEDRNGDIWISTNNGITKFHHDTKIFRSYTISDGLQGKEFFPRSCCIGYDGEMFFGGKNGLSAFYPENIKDDTCKPPVVLTDFQIFNQSVPIGKVSRDRVILHKSITETEEIKLTHRDRIFSIAFSAINYSSPERSQFAYRMIGFDDEKDGWNYIGSRRFVTYTNLPAGSYIFQVKATNGDGIWNDTPASLKIYIKPPFWKTWLFRILLFVFVAGTAGAFFRVRMLMMRKQKKLLEEKVKSRTRQLSEAKAKLEERQQEIESQAKELRSRTSKLKMTNLVLEEQKEELKTLNATKDKFFSIIAHDLKNPFSTILGFCEILTNKFHTLEREKIAYYIKLINLSSLKVFNLLENLLQWSRTQSNNVDYVPKNISLAGIFENNIHLLQEMAEKKNNVISINMDEDITVFADKNMINAVVMNLLTNSIKFTAKGRISISAVSNDHEVLVTIKDTGIGMRKEQLDKLFMISESITLKGTAGEDGTGLGLIICREFIEKHNGRIWAESEDGKGTAFHFTLPLV